MKSMARWLVVAFSLFLLQAPAVRAADEVLVVEPLNTTVFFGFLAGVFAATKVQRPETVCGNPNGNPANLVDCYEFATTYATYDSTGQQIFHLPECNAVAPDNASCDDAANNLCAGNLALDPRQIKAPVCGKLRIDILPLTTDEPLTLGQQTTGSWDGDLTNVSPLGEVYLWGMQNGALDGGVTYALPRIRIPASSVHHLFADPTTTPAVVSATHEPLTPVNTFQLGYFNILNRLFIFNQQLGDACNTVITPMFFGTCC
jgi:hypothetical protein